MSSGQACILKQKPPAGDEEQAVLDVLSSFNEESRVGVSTVRVKVSLSCSLIVGRWQTAA